MWLVLDLETAQLSDYLIHTEGSQLCGWHVCKFSCLLHWKWTAHNGKEQLKLSLGQQQGYRHPSCASGTPRLSWNHYWHLSWCWARLLRPHSYICWPCHGEWWWEAPECLRYHQSHCRHWWCLLFSCLKKSSAFEQHHWQPEPAQHWVVASECSLQGCKYREIYFIVWVSILVSLHGPQIVREGSNWKTLLQHWHCPKDCHTGRLVSYAE